MNGGQGSIDERGKKNLVIPIYSNLTMLYAEQNTDKHWNRKEELGTSQPTPVETGI
jgi:hypothetical protein